MQIIPSTKESSFFVRSDGLEQAVEKRFPSMKMHTIVMPSEREALFNSSGLGDLKGGAAFFVNTLLARQIAVSKDGFGLLLTGRNWPEALHRLWRRMADVNSAPAD